MKIQLLTQRKNFSQQLTLKKLISHTKAMPKADTIVLSKASSENNKPRIFHPKTISNLYEIFKHKSKNNNVDHSNEEVKKFSNFEIFKNLKMCNPLKSYELKKCFNFFCIYRSNPKIFLATINGDKPMGTFSEVKSLYNPSKNCFNILKKLDLGENFEWTSTPCRRDFEFQDKTWNYHLLNKKEVHKTIEKNKQLYTLRLNLDKNTSTDQIYKTIKEALEKNNLASDLYGITLGFPKYDTIIFYLESCCGLNYSNRQDQNYKNKLISFFESKNSPYKELSLDEQTKIKKYIENIDQKNLLNNAQIINIYNGIYSFINFCNDKAELDRLKNAVKNFNKTFKLENI